MRIAAIVLGVLMVLTAVVSWNVWHASHDPLPAMIGPFEEGRMKLHGQLEQAKKTEGDAEKQEWNSPEGLRAMLNGHQERIQKLTGNSQATEILAYDHEAIDRLQKRISDLAEQAAAKAELEEQQAQDAAATQ